MSTNIEKFNRRWETVEKETLSSVRRQFKAHVFDITEVNHDFRMSCNEWFQGKLSASIWYKELMESNSEKASAFKESIAHFELKEAKKSRPNGFWVYLLTLLSLPFVFLVIGYITEWELLGKAVFSIGFSVLVWTACNLKYNTQVGQYEETVVDSYRKQLEEHKKVLNEILS